MGSSTGRRGSSAARLTRFASSRGALLTMLAAGLAGSCSTEGPFLKRTGDFELSFELHGRQREVQVHLPAGYTGADPTPLLFALHGGGGSGSQMRQTRQLDPAADELGFIVAYPDGVLGWAYAGSDLEQQGVDDVAFVAELIERLDNLLVVDPDRIYVTGFSNGGFMAQTLACRLSSSFAGAAPVAATVPHDIAGECRVGGRISILMVNGTRDQSVPYDGDPSRGLLSVDESIRIWAARNRCDSTPNVSSVVTDSVSGFAARREAYPDCAAGVETVLYALEDVGHQWPTTFFPTSVMIGEFLLRHHR